MSWETVTGTMGGEIVKLGEGEGRVKEVVGVYLDVKQGTHGPLYVLETEGGKVISVPNNKDLEEKLDPVKMLNKLVRITYTGVKALKGGKTLKTFGVSAYNGVVTPELQAKYPSLKGEAEALAEKPAALKEDDSDPDLPF